MTNHLLVASVLHFGAGFLSTPFNIGSATMLVDPPDATRIKVGSQPALSAGPHAAPAVERPDFHTLAKAVRGPGDA